MHIFILIFNQLELTGGLLVMHNAKSSLLTTVVLNHSPA